MKKKWMRKRYMKKIIRSIARLLHHIGSFFDKWLITPITKFLLRITDLFKDNSKNFDKDTSLYFQYEESPQITYMNYIQGVLPVGSYCFYFNRSYRREFPRHSALDS